MRSARESRIDEALRRRRMREEAPLEEDELATMAQDRRTLPDAFGRRE